MDPIFVISAFQYLNKLRPSFPIIKDNKAKDRAGVGAW